MSIERRKSSQSGKPQAKKSDWPVIVAVGLFVCIVAILIHEPAAYLAGTAVMTMGVCVPLVDLAVGFLRGLTDRDR